MKKNVIILLTILPVILALSGLSVWLWFPARSGEDQKLQVSVPQSIPSVRLAFLPWQSAPQLEDQRQAEESSAGDHPIIRLDAEFDGGFAPNVVKISPTHFSLDFKHNPARMFLFKLDGVKNSIVRIDLLNLSDSNMHNWVTLNPVYSENASWSSLPSMSFETHPFTSASDISSNGATVPKLNIDKSWSYVSNVWEDSDEERLSFVQTFQTNTAVIAMKYPFVGDTSAQLAKSIESNSKVEVLTAGKSVKGAPLYIMHIKSLSTDENRRIPCIVIYAREHADEHDTSWASVGAVEYLLSGSNEAEDVREKAEFLIIPCLDPDGASIEKHEYVMDTFVTDNSTPESLQYAAFFKQWIDSGHRLDLVVNLHNVESVEQPHIMCPGISANPKNRNDATKVLAAIYERVHNDGFLAKKTLRAIPLANRLGSWLEDNYSIIHLPLEINSQEPHRHLLLSELEWLGRDVVLGCSDFLSSPAGIQYLARIDNAHGVRLSNWEKYGDKVKGESNALIAEQTVRWMGRSDELLEKVEIQRTNDAILDNDGVSSQK